MSNTLLAEFEGHVAELRGRLPDLTGDSRRDAAAELESMTEFLDLLALLRQPARAGGAGASCLEQAAQAADAVSSTRLRRREA